MGTFEAQILDIANNTRRFDYLYRRLRTRKLNSAKQISDYFNELLTTTSALYLNHLLLKKMESKFPAQSAKGVLATQVESSHASKPKELGEIIRLLQYNLTSLPCWLKFKPYNGFHRENCLKSSSDYIDRLIIHFPEISLEVSRSKPHIQKLLREPTLESAEELLHRLEHLAHHASYCRHALEILSQEVSWLKEI